MKNSDSSGEMRVIIVTEDDPLYVIEFFDVFFEEFPRSDFTIVGVTVVDAFHEPIWKTAWRMFRFYGLVDFVRLGCKGEVHCDACRKFGVAASGHWFCE